jgi:hypothetical protein
LGHKYLGCKKAELERRKTGFATSKEQSEAILKRLDFKRTQLEGVTTPDAYVNWALSGFDDPVLGPALREAGSSPEKVMERINQAAQQPNALQNLIEESKLGSDKFAQLVKDRAGQQITVRGQNIQARKQRGVVKTFKPKHRGGVKTLLSNASVILRLLKIKPQLRLAVKSWLKTRWKPNVRCRVQ